MLKAMCDICHSEEKVKQYGLWLHNSDPFTISGPNFYYADNNSNNPESFIFKDLCKKCHLNFIERIKSAIQKEIKNMEGSGVN